MDSITPFIKAIGELAMKKILLNLSAVALTIGSLNAFAVDKVTITGEPVTLTKSGDMYMVPEGYNVTTAYHYVTLDNTKRVCFADSRPDYASLNVMNVNVMVNGTKATWYCYEYNPDYFVIDNTGAAATTTTTTTAP